MAALLTGQSGQRTLLQSCEGLPCGPVCKVRRALIRAIPAKRNDDATKTSEKAQSHHTQCTGFPTAHNCVNDLKSLLQAVNLLFANYKSRLALLNASLAWLPFRHKYAQNIRTIYCLQNCLVIKKLLHWSNNNRRCIDFLCRVMHRPKQRRKEAQVSHRGQMGR